MSKHISKGGKVEEGCWFNAIHAIHAMSGLYLVVPPIKKCKIGQV